MTKAQLKQAYAAPSHKVFKAQLKALTYVAESIKKEIDKEQVTHFSQAQCVAYTEKANASMAEARINKQFVRSYPARRKGA